MWKWWIRRRWSVITADKNGVAWKGQTDDLKGKEDRGTAIKVWGIYMARRRVTRGVGDGRRGQREVTGSEEEMTMAWRGYEMGEDGGAGVEGKKKQRKRERWEEGVGPRRKRSRERRGRCIHLDRLSKRESSASPWCPELAWPSVARTQWDERREGSGDEERDGEEEEGREGGARVDVGRKERRKEGGFIVDSPDLAGLQGQWNGGWGFGGFSGLMDFIFWHGEKVSEKESIIFCSFVAFAIKTLQNVANKTSEGTE